MRFSVILFFVLSVVFFCCDSVKAQATPPPGGANVECLLPSSTVFNWSTSTTLKRICPNVANSFQIYLPRDRYRYKVSRLCVYTKVGTECPPPPVTHWDDPNFISIDINFPCEGFVFQDLQISEACDTNCNNINAAYEAALEAISRAMLAYYKWQKIEEAMAQLEPCEVPYEDYIYCGTYYYVDGSRYDPNYYPIRDRYLGAIRSAEILFRQATEIPCVPAPPVVCLADFDEDGIVDGTDFVSFASEFTAGTTDILGRSQVDLNEDGTVDGDDWLMFMNAFAEGC